MHSKYDRLVVFLIVGGSLLMLFGAVSSLLNYVGYVNRGTVSSESLLASQQIQSSKEQPITSQTAVKELSESEKLEKKIVESLITAINDEHKEEDVYKELLKLQAGKPDLELFKKYISFLRILCPGNVVGYKPVAAKESKAISFEMMENWRTSLLVPSRYKCFNLVSELASKQEEMHLLVLDYTDGKLEISERLINDLLEPHYIARLYAEGLNNNDKNLLANLLYTDLPDDDDMRLVQADAYIDFYKRNIDASVDNLRIEEARPDTWLISFPKKEVIADSLAEDINSTVSNTEQATTVASLEAAVSKATTVSKTTALDDKLQQSADLTVKPFNILHFSPNYFTRWQFKDDRHYVQFVRKNGNMVAIDYMPLDDLKGAWHVANALEKSTAKLDLSSTLHLIDIKKVFTDNMQMKKLLYNEAVYSGLIKPQLPYEDKVDKIYSHVLNFQGTGVETYSFLRRNDTVTNPLADMILFSAKSFKCDSLIKIGMKRSELLKLYPGIAMSNYRLILGQTIMEIHFDNQTKSGITMSKNSKDDRLTHILYYNIEWLQQDFDMANLHYVS